ncbi:uncharacterized protein LOC111704541 [Eurytemora carolleeae]|uniref:uncharacterized protein LOC111704541 n=1 Tax=Eurytemora carolleeae TaxID=1294199 RepID=UPI000C758E5F|nr:uncharacterized protein LOC111704541 [Eurytemora carolleeae]|eukprot:XP_023332566.1 uncharacterized protein LOC111704541 [Eurytemora affinis]
MNNSRFDPYKALVSLHAKFPKYFNEEILRYVITASHCVCPTDYSEREKLKTCHEGKERIKLHSNYPIQIDICLAVSDERECQMDIEYDRAYRVTELVVRKERLAKDNLKTFDIALLKLDRRVRFNTDISPICLPGALQFKKPTNELAFVSGFGNTEYSPEKDNKAECGTDMFLPRPYHSCAGSCQKSNPPIDSLDETICSWLIYKNMDTLLKANWYIFLNKMIYLLNIFL